MKKRRKKRARPVPASAPAAPAKPAATRHPLLLFALAPVLAVLAFRSVSAFEFVGDARFLIVDNRFAHSLEHLSATLSHDYFWSSSGNIIPYWRPVTKLSWLFEWQLFRDWAGGYAWVNVAWHAFGSAGVAALALSLGRSRALAVASAVVYALHPIAIEPVSLIMARSDVVATSATIWAIASWHLWRRRVLAGEPARALLVLHGAATALALGSKEAALGLPLSLVVWAALEGDFARPARQRLRLLVPALVLGLLYFVTRKWLLERQAPGLSATAIAFDPLRIAASLGFYLRETFPLAQSSGLREVPVAEARSAAFLGKTLLTLGAFVALATVAWRRREMSLLALLAWVVAALLPVVLPKHIAVVTEAAKYPLADRWLYNALCPAILAWAALLERAGSSLEQRYAFPRARAARAGSALLGVWALVLLWRSSPDRAGLGSDLAMLDNEDRVFYQAIPPEYRTPRDDCRHDEGLLAKASLLKQPERVLELAPAALARCSAPEFDLYYLEALVALGRYDLAEPVARRLAAKPPHDRRSHGRVAALAGATLLERGHALEARPLIESAVRLGALACPSFIGLAEAARKQGRLAGAATYAETAYECGQRRDASLLVAAATWLAAAGERERARAVLERTRGLALSPDQAEQAGAVGREVGVE
jgi:tetratricopeptide (TPR) repeat protein